MKIELLLPNSAMLTLLLRCTTLNAHFTVGKLPDKSFVHKIAVNVVGRGDYGERLALLLNQNSPRRLNILIAILGSKPKSVLDEMIYGLSKFRLNKYVIEVYKRKEYLAT